MVPSISKDQAYQNVLPLIKDLMKDDNQEVRKGGIEASAKFIEILGSENINSLYPSLKTCLEDGKWRVRLELIKNIIELSLKTQVKTLIFRTISSFQSIWNLSFLIISKKEYLPFEQSPLIRFKT